MNSAHVTVKIYGESYSLKTVEPVDRLEELARFVDARMREVAASGKVVTTSRIAVLAALHIADELFSLREAAAAIPARADLERRLTAIVEILDRALSPAAKE